MKAKFADGCECLQIVFYIENKEEELLLKEFMKCNYNKDYKFWIHGSTYTDEKFSSMNFGFIKRNVKTIKKRSVIQMFKRLSEVFKHMGVKE